MSGEQKTRPFLVALGLGTESYHLAFRPKVALCGGELQPGSFKWAPWSEDGKALLLGPLACQRCHDVMISLDDKTFLAIMERQVVMSGRMKIDRPADEVLGFKFKTADREPEELTEDEKKRALGLLETLTRDPLDDAEAEAEHAIEELVGTPGGKEKALRILREVLAPKAEDDNTTQEDS